MQESHTMSTDGIRSIVPPPSAGSGTDRAGGMAAFETLESGVRSYCRAFPRVFATAKGAVITDEEGREYVDFFSGAGALNYGHNPPAFKEAMLEYLRRDGVLHSLDMATEAKRNFLERFAEVILRPRGLDYRVQFPGPTGTNAVEAALKLARKITGRRTVACFANGYHGMTLGALAVTGNRSKRAGAGVPLHYTLPLPFDGDLGPGVDTLDYFERALGNSGSGVEPPAAVIVETVQAEGGVKVASDEWLRRLAALARRHGILLIVDDIQVGCGRTGTFFSFEPAGIQPDLVCLSKSISGAGLPMALVLIRPELDVWEPGEHNGTFRGNNLAFVAAAEALRYWEGGGFASSVAEAGEILRRRLQGMVDQHPQSLGSVRGRGMIQGIAFEVPGLATRVARAAFERGVIVETAGPEGEVLKLLPPLNIPRETMETGLRAVEGALRAALGETGLGAPARVSVRHPVPQPL